MKLMYRLSKSAAQAQFVETGDGRSERSIEVKVKDLTAEQRKMLLDLMPPYRTSIMVDDEIHLPDMPTGVSQWPDSSGKAKLTMDTAVVDHVLGTPDQWFEELARIISAKASFADALAKRQAEIDAQKADEERQEKIKTLLSDVADHMATLSALIERLAITVDNQ